MDVEASTTLNDDDYESLRTGLTVEERIRGYLLSAEADYTLRNGTKMTEAERKLLEGGAEWERGMHRLFKGICTRAERRQNLRRTAVRMGVHA